MSAIRFSTAKNAGRSEFDVKRWETAENMAKLSSGAITDDIILGEGASISFEPNPEWFYQRNANALVIAGSGQGKTRDVIIPNLLNHMPVNYVVTDTKGELRRATAAGFAKNGYSVQVLDTIDLEASACFNPLAYIADESDIPSFAKLIFDTVSPNRNAGTVTDEDFWNSTAEMLLEAVIGLCFACEEIDGKFSEGWEGGREPRYLNMEHVLKLIDLVTIPPEGTQDSAPSPLDFFVRQLSEGSIYYDPLEED